jgi:hypothetical protein
MKKQLIIILLTVFSIHINGQEPDSRNFDSIFIQLEEVGGCIARVESHYYFEIEKKKGYLKIIRNNETLKTKLKKEEIDKFLPEFFAYNTAKMKDFYEIKDSCNIPTGDFSGTITLKIHNKDNKIEKEIKFKSIVCSDLEFIKFRNWIISTASYISQIE